jgi:hypothetical protein
MYVECWADDYVTSGHDVYDPDGINIFSSGTRDGSGWIPAEKTQKVGWYRVKAYRQTVWNNASGTKVTYIGRNYHDYVTNSYMKSCSSDFAKNIRGAQRVRIPSFEADGTRYPDIHPYLYGPTSVGEHSIKLEDGQLWYKRGSSDWVKITNRSRAIRDPSLAVDGGGNAYVAWEEQYWGDDWDIWFQKIPYNFAPATGTAINRNGIGSVRAFSPASEQTTQSPTLEAPILIKPKGGDTVTTRRPTFEWKAPKGMYEKYLPVWAKDKADLSNPAKRGEGRTMREAIDSTSKPNDPYSYFGYTIPYIDPALEANVLYYWTVLATTGEATVSPEAETFRCEPDFEISGVTNYPNPFNPNKEETNIRYKLSKNADEVKIRIYDITGALVVELDGDTQGEGTSMMTKYNDVKWNGRNGRGDMVMNGIYPFEVVARSGDKTVSGRGKIAVLK